MTRYPNNEQRGDQHIDRQPDLTDDRIKRTLTCGHTVMVTFKKNAHYCESCRARRRPVASMDEE